MCAPEREPENPDSLGLLAVVITLLGAAAIAYVASLREILTGLEGLLVHVLLFGALVVMVVTAAVLACEVVSKARRPQLVAATRVVARELPEAERLALPEGRVTIDRHISPAALSVAEQVEDR